MSGAMCLQVNGLSTLFWGWGREDDELYLRMKEAKMTVHEFMHVLGLTLERRLPLGKEMSLL